METAKTLERTAQMPSFPPPPATKHTKPTRRAGHGWNLLAWTSSASGRGVRKCEQGMDKLAQTWTSSRVHVCDPVASLVDDAEPEPRPLLCHLRSSLQMSDSSSPKTVLRDLLLLGLSGFTFWAGFRVCVARNGKSLGQGWALATSWPSAPLKINSLPWLQNPIKPLAMPVSSS